MEKIIGGENFEASFPIKVSHKILWPCYEFIAQANGLKNFAKNILDEFILRLAAIDETDTAAIAEKLGLETDLVSFIQSRLEQRGYIDSCYRITEDGKNALGEFSKIEGKDIHVYVDAVSGRIIPYYSFIDDDNHFSYSYGEDCVINDGYACFKYKGYSSAGTETDEMQMAYKLHYNDNYNHVPDSHEVTQMLHKLHPRSDSVFARVDEMQEAKRNLRWMLIDVLQPEGSSRDWIFTDGFGHITSFYSVDKLKNDNDQRFITGLRGTVRVQTNSADGKETSKNIKCQYPKLTEKLNQAQSCMKELTAFVDSPDKEEAYHSALVDSLLSVTQLAEWVIYYLCHEKKNEYLVGAMFSKYDKFRYNKASPYLIGKIAARISDELGFECRTDDKKSLNQRYGKLWYAVEKQPQLFSLVDVLLLSFEKEAWLRAFAKNHKDFISVLTDLNKNRNSSFHSGAVTDYDEIKSLIENAYSQILDLMKEGLGVTVKGSKELSFAEKVAIQNERDKAISRMEQVLGFVLCNTLDNSLITFVTDMEKRGAAQTDLNKAVVLDEYRILEYLFNSVNECLDSEFKNSDWKVKAAAAKFIYSENSRDFEALTGTDSDRINTALERKPSSMNAACIAFLTLADVSFLRQISAKWNSMLSDVSYIAYKRGHGEIPVSIDAERVMKIKEHIFDLIHFFAENGFLMKRNVN